MKYVKGYKGEMLPGPVRGGKPVKRPGTIGGGMVAPSFDPTNVQIPDDYQRTMIQSSGGLDDSTIQQIKNVMNSQSRTPRPAPTAGPMIPVRGGGNLPKSLAVIARRAMKKGGAVKSSASKRADGCVKKGKTKGKMV